MINWSNSDKLSSWKKLMSLKGMVSVADELSGSSPSFCVCILDIGCIVGCGFNWRFLFLGG